MKKLTTYWPSSISQSDVRKIRQRFGITAGTTVNGETPAEIKDEDLPLLEETARRGYISIRGYKPELEGLFNIKAQDNV